MAPGTLFVPLAPLANTSATTAKPIARIVCLATESDSTAARSQSTLWSAVEQSPVLASLAADAAMDTTTKTVAANTRREASPPETLSRKTA
jgi:hypothetical protein